MRLFDDIERISKHPSAVGESEFEFLNRIDEPWFGEIRDVLERWFERLPADVQGDVRSRYRSKDAGTAQGAFWEMYIHELFRWLGYRLVPHPAVPGSRSKPDYLVERRGESFYLEATAVAASDEEAAAENRLAVIQDTLNRMQTEDFDFGFMVQTTGPASPPLKGLRTELEAWSRSHDPETVMRAFEQTGRLPIYRWRDGGWAAEFSLVPRGPERRGDSASRPIGLFSPPGGIIDDVTPLLNALRAKATKYGDPDRPLLIALLSNRTFVREPDFRHALFGGGASRRGGSQDGLWLGPGGPQNRRVSAVLTTRRLRPETITKARPQLWLNPWAKEQLGSDLPFRQITLDVDSDEFVREAGPSEVHELFGLPEDWPGPDDPWEKAGGVQPRP